MTPEPHKSVPGSLSAAFGAKVTPKKSTGATVRRGAPKAAATPPATAPDGTGAGTLDPQPPPAAPAGRGRQRSTETAATPKAEALAGPSGATTGPQPTALSQVKQRWTLFIDEDVSEAVKVHCADAKMTRADLVMVAYNKTHQQLPDLLSEEQRHLSDPGDMFPVVAKPISRAKKQLAVNVPVSFAQHIDRQVQELAAPDRSHTINVLLRAYLQL